MLETKIQENTEAVQALTAAITALMAALQRTPQPAPVSAPAPAPAPVSAPAPAPVQAPVSAPAAEQKPLTGDELRKLCVRAGAEGLTDVVVTFLSERGLQRLTQLPSEQYPDLVALLKSKGVE